jgi:hypothetical protein
LRIVDRNRGGDAAVSHKTTIILSGQNADRQRTIFGQTENLDPDPAGLPGSGADKLIQAAARVEKTSQASR